MIVHAPSICILTSGAPSETQILRAARHRQRRDAPYRDAAAHRGSWVKVVHVRTLTVFFSISVFSRGNTVYTEPTCFVSD